MVSPHPDDVITIYSCLPNDAELSNVLCQPSTAEIQYLTYNMVMQNTDVKDHYPL